MASFLLTPVIAFAPSVLGGASGPPGGGGRASPEAAAPRDGELEPAASHARMVATLAEVARRSEIEDIFVGAGDLPSLREQLAALPPGKKVKDRWMILCKIGVNELRLGNDEAAVEACEQAVALHERLAGQVDAKQLRRARFQLALSWLRLGESRNCVARHTSDSCILPIGKKGVHVEQEGSRKAIAALSDLLAEDPDDLTARWLINVAYMTLGEHPQGVPEAFRIGLKAFAADADFPKFVDCAPALGLTNRGLAGGVIVDDFDGDHVLDFLSSSMHPAGQLRFFRGQRDGTFVDRTAEAGLTGIFGGLNLVQTDYDGDGRLDVFVPRGAWLLENGAIPPSLLRNAGDGTFTDVTCAAGLAEQCFPSQTAAWADIDNDGDLDLYKGNEFSPKIAAHCQLFRNEGDGTFVDVAEEAGVQNDRYAKGVVWGDYDGDRLPDLYVSNVGQRNRLYRNKGDGTFEDVAERLGVEGPRDSFPVWFWDYDNDGVLDLYVSSFLPRMEHWVQGLLGIPDEAERACLYRGDGRGGFVDMARTTGLTDVTVTMAGNFGDLDNDGFLDFYLGTGFPAYEALMPNKMYWNRAGKRFDDVTTSGGFGHLQKGHAIAFADVDRDGDQDVYADIGGGFAGDAFGNALFRNPGFGNHWITVKLVGVRSNRPGIGARIRCEVTEDGVKRSIWRHVNSGGSFGANPLRQMIGLGKATKVDVLEVHWPTSDRMQAFRDVAADGLVEITEGIDELRRIE